MNTTSNRFDLSLAHQATFQVTDAAGVQIACHRGSLWVTLDGDPRDIVLDEGQRFVATEHRRALIYALAPSSLSLSEASAAAARRAARACTVSGTRMTCGLQPA
jgi:hypothetical protein